MDAQEAELIARVMDTLSQQIGNLAPGKHRNFYSEYDQAWRILRKYEQSAPQREDK